MSVNELKAPPHPFWCDDCGANSPFKIKGCPIEHTSDCPRHGEDAEAAYNNAVEYCRTTGKKIS